MNLLYIANARIPSEKANGLQITKMCQSFSDARLSVELIIPKRINPEFKNTNPYSFYGVKENFTIHKLKILDPRFLLAVKSGWYIKVEALSFAIRLFFFMLMKKNKKDYFFYTRDEYLLPLLQLFSKRVIWEAHYLPSKLSFYLPFWRQCHRIIVLTSFLKNELIKLGLPQEKILVSPDAVDLDEFTTLPVKEKLRQELNLPLNKKIIAYVGKSKTRGESKGVENIAAVFSELSRKHSNLMLLLVGLDNLEKENLIGEFNNLKINPDSYRLYCHEPHASAIKFIKSADILVMNYPNTPYHAFFLSALKMFEYMASGNVIVAPDLPSMREVLNEKNALLFTADSREGLEQSLAKLINDANLADQLSTQALLDVASYTWPKRAQAIINFIA
jgi:glycosyltransferase involved in cell wall biosynthesis